MNTYDHEGEELDFSAFDDELDLSGDGSHNELDPDDEYALNGYYANSVSAHDHPTAAEED